MLSYRMKLLDMYRKFILLLTAMVLAAACTVKDGSVVAEVVIDKSEVKIIKGSTVQLNADVLPETAQDRTVTWSSDNQAVAFVDQTGLVEAIATGTANITAAAGGKTAVCEVTVSAVPVESVAITNGDEEGTQLSAVEIQRTQSLQLTVVVTPADVLGTEYSAIWKSSDENVATVDDKGLVTAVAKSGESLITVAVGDKTAECKVTALPRSIDFLMTNETSKSLKIGETWQMGISGSPSDNDDTVSWASSDEAVATVSDGGLVTAVGKGNAKITAKSTLSPKAHYAECDLMVYGDEVALDMQFVTIPAGAFWMGSPKGVEGVKDEPTRQSNETRHRVTITKPFQIGVYEVTNAQYAQFLNATGVTDDGKSKTTKNELLYASSGSCDWGLHYDSVAEKWVPAPGYDNYPVIEVNWYGASEFAEWAGGSLPTEAQWEYACRGGMEDRPFGLGDGIHLDGTLANYQCRQEFDYEAGGTKFNKDANYLERTTEVGSYKPNAYGLYDMHGNVYEWCSDLYIDDLGADPVTDPSGPDTALDDKRLVRGGCYDSSPRVCRNASRLYMSPVATEGQKFGFRIVKPVE